MCKTGGGWLQPDSQNVALVARLVNHNLTRAMALIEEYFRQALRSLGRHVVRRQSAIERSLRLACAKSVCLVSYVGELHGILIRLCNRMVEKGATGTID